MKHRDLRLLRHLCTAALLLPPSAFGTQEVGMLINALAHHSARELELIRHLSVAYATATGNTGGGGGWPGSASGRAVGVGVGGQLVDVQAVCNVLHGLASLNVRSVLKETYYKGKRDLLMLKETC